MRITFTGESQTGAAIMKACAPTVKPVSFELGGKNAAIVFADCDFEATLAGMSDAVFLNTGQVCLCAERVYVERAIFRSIRGRYEGEGRSAELRLADGGVRDDGPADLGAASREGALVLSFGSGRRGRRSSPAATFQDLVMRATRASTCSPRFLPGCRKRRDV